MTGSTKRQAPRWQTRLLGALACAALLSPMQAAAQGETPVLSGWISAAYVDGFNLVHETGHYDVAYDNAAGGEDGGSWVALFDAGDWVAVTGRPAGGFFGGGEDEIEAQSVELIRRGDPDFSDLIARRQLDYDLSVAGQ